MYIYIYICSLEFCIVNYTHPKSNMKPKVYKDYLEVSNRRWRCCWIWHNCSAVWKCWWRTVFEYMLPWKCPFHKWADDPCSTRLWGLWLVVSCFFLPVLPSFFSLIHLRCSVMDLKLQGCSRFRLSVSHSSRRYIYIYICVYTHTGFTMFNRSGESYKGVQLVTWLST